MLKMRILKDFTNREKIIFSFLIILILINAITIVYINSLTSFSNSFRSMLDDRLVPASDISKINELLYKNRLMLEELVFKVEAHDKSYKSSIRNNNFQIDSIIYKYSHTHLTLEERTDYHNFLKKHIDYQKLEDFIIDTYQQKDVPNAQELFVNVSGESFRNMLLDLNKLAAIQVEVGENLYQDSTSKINIIRLVSYLSIAIAIFVTMFFLKTIGMRIN